MVAAAFPLAKLAYLAVKQISKPFASKIKDGAKRSHFFRTYVCMPPAQFYHWVEVNIKMKMLNLGKPTEVPKLNEAMAIELGAELLGEGVVFVFASACLVAEYIRSSHKEKEKEAAHQARIQDLEDRLFELEFRLAEQTARLQELHREVCNKDSLIHRFLHHHNDDPEDQSSEIVNKPQKTSLINEAIAIAGKSVRAG